MKHGTRIARAGLSAMLFICAGWHVPAGASAAPAPASTTPPAHAVDGGFDIGFGADTVSVRFTAANVVRVHFKPGGHATSPSLVVTRQAAAPVAPDVRVDKQDDGLRISSGRVAAAWNAGTGMLIVADAQSERVLVRMDIAAMREGRLAFTHDADDALYGIGGYDAWEDASAGLLRSGTLAAKAGEQGHAGAPFVWSTAGWGLLVDTIGADFALRDGTVAVDRMSRKDIDCYVIVGTPPQLFGALAAISGRPPMFPKWAMGFTNSQWGIDQPELLRIVDTYRAKHIPIDNFTLDFDWKAWGEDDYGEFRWNTTKFPDGPSGTLKAEMDRRGIHLTGIMKPRIHLDTVQGRYATTHHLWLASKPASDDYFSHKPVRDIDFDKPAARAWFFNDALKHSFATGIVGWWNDEADDSGDDTQFLNMQRALYDGQRAMSDLRVWSLNRNFYLGAQRYAYGLWSGDIDTGFASMAGQRARMLSAVDVGAMQWGMDGGGFKGRPGPENYARWIQFGAFTPLFRVHGSFDEKRQPWVYGPVAEKAATAAIRLRYTLIPYIYAWMHRDHADGLGLVRPLIFDWPHDPQVRNDIDAWMFGDGLLVSPVVEEGQRSKRIYLPAGTWTDYFTGTVYKGGQTIEHAVDSRTWSDIPLFIRAGAIIPTWPPMDYVDQKPVTTLDVDVFPDTRRTRFDYYDDDGNTYAYEHGAYFLQPLAVQRAGGTVTFETGAVEGTYKPALRFYLLKIHGHHAVAVDADGQPLQPFADPEALQHASGEGWATGHDRYGDVTWIRIAAAQQRKLTLALQSAEAQP